MSKFKISFEGAQENDVYSVTKQFEDLQEATKYAECKVFSIRCKETGTLIDEFANLTEAKNALFEYETEDKKDGTYEPDFYEICFKDEPI
jgi:hypothetical protein